MVLEIEKIEKAIHILESKNSIPLETETFEDISHAYDIAIEALKKQIPKKPINSTIALDNKVAVGMIGKCPCCNTIISEDILVCDCGQKID